MGREKLSSSVQEAQTVLEKAKNVSPEDQLVLLQSDFSPRPVAEPSRPLAFTNKAKDMNNISGRYVYALFLIPEQNGRNAKLYLRTHKESEKPFDQYPIDLVYREMDMEAEVINAKRLRTGEFKIAGKRVDDQAYDNSPWSKALMEEMYRLHFQGFRIHLY